MIYVVTLLVGLARRLSPADTQRVAHEWARRSDATLDASMCGVFDGIDGELPVLRVAGRVEADRPTLAERAHELVDALHEQGVEVAEWREVSIVSLDEHDRRARARAAASAS